MKKLSIYASMLLAATLGTSCDSKDNPIVEEPKTIIELDGQQYETDLVATFQGEVGSEVTLTLGVYDQYDIYGVDFGDGVIVADTVCFENGGLKDENGITRTDTQHTSATKFTGTIAGDGIIKVYGNSDLWYVNLMGGVAPTSFDQPKLAHVVQVSITAANVEEIVLPEMAELKQFSFNNSPLKSIDLSKAPNLTSLTINSTTASKFEPQLESIDLSNNTELTYLSLQANQNTSGKLTTIDLTKNVNLESFYLQYNQLSEIKLAAEYPKLGLINIQNNKLTEFDFTRLPYIKDIYAQGNQLTSVDLSGMTRSGGNVYFQENQLTELTIPVSVKYLYAQDNKLTKISIADATTGAYMQNNQLTIATLPAKPAGLNTTAKIKRFVYAPQAALQVAEEVTELDLSAQLTAQGILEAPATTVYSFVTAGGTALVEGTDYQVTAPGKFKFIKAQSEKVHGVMTNEALPLFEGANAFVTTEFTIKAAAAAETVLFSWEAGVANGGSVEGNGADAGKVTESAITVSSKKANIDADNITITLNQALAAGDVIKMTGYRKKDSDANGNLYILFENGASIDEGNEVTWNNIHENVGQEPNTNTYEVTDGAGSKTIKMARSKSGTNVFITKIEIIRK